MPNEKNTVNSMLGYYTRRDEKHIWHFTHYNDYTDEWKGDFYIRGNNGYGARVEIPTGWFTRHKGTEKVELHASVTLKRIYKNAKAVGGSMKNRTEKQVAYWRLTGELP